MKDLALAQRLLAHPVAHPPAGGRGSGLRVPELAGGIRLREAKTARSTSSGCTTRHNPPPAIPQ